LRHRIETLPAGRARQVVLEHKELVRAVSQKDYREAQEIIKHHIQAGREYIFSGHLRPVTPTSLFPRCSPCGEAAEAQDKAVFPLRNGEVIQTEGDERSSMVSRIIAISCYLAEGASTESDPRSYLRMSFV